MNLYEISTQFAVAAAQLQELDLDDQTLADTLEGLQGDLEVKAQNTAVVAMNLEALADKIKEAEEAMRNRRKAIENRAAAIRSYILRCMQAGHIQRIDSPMFRISVRRNPPAVIVDDAQSIPADFWRQAPPPPPVLDKAAVKEAIQAGQEVPGAHLEQSERLDIR